MELDVIPCAEHSIEFRSTILREEHRPVVALLDTHRESLEDFLTLCSWCRKVKVAAQWVEVEEALRLLKLFESETLPRISHGVCPACTEAVLHTLR